jgi:hypothetical protein
VRRRLALVIDVWHPEVKSEELRSAITATFPVLEERETAISPLSVEVTDMLNVDDTNSGSIATATIVEVPSPILTSSNVIEACSVAVARDAFGEIYRELDYFPFNRNNKVLNRSQEEKETNLPNPDIEQHRESLYKEFYN